MEKIKKTDSQWKELLTEEQFQVTRRKGTEPAFCGAFYDHKQAGTYRCICCDLELFSAEHKFDSGTGWPSFFMPIEPGHIQEKIDLSLGMIRTEIACARCDAHLGHVFKDGPKPSGLRYCLNSVSLRFVPVESKEDKDE